MRCSKCIGMLKCSFILCHENLYARTYNAAEIPTIELLHTFVPVRNILYVLPFQSDILCAALGFTLRSGLFVCVSEHIFFSSCRSVLSARTKTPCILIFSGIAWKYSIYLGTRRVYIKIQPIFLSDL